MLYPTRPIAAATNTITTRAEPITVPFIQNQLNQAISKTRLSPLFPYYYLYYS